MFFLFIGRADECVILPIQFVNRLASIDEQDVKKPEELQLFAAVLVMGLRSGPKSSRYQASILFKLIEVDAQSSSVSKEISERFGRLTDTVRYLIQHANL